MNGGSFIHGRKRTPDKRGRILDAAVKVFARKGYFGARVSEIARNARVADGTIYLYFRNKEDILVSLFDEVMAEHIEKGRQELATVEGAEARLLVIARAPPAAAGRQPRPGGGLPGRAAAVDEVHGALHRGVAAGLPGGHLRGHRGGARATGPSGPELSRKLATKAFFGALDEMVTSWILSPKEYDLVGQAGPVVDLFLHGAAAPRAESRTQPALAAAGRGRR